MNCFAFVSVIQSRKWMFSVYISHNFFVSSKIINMFLLVKSLNQCWFLMLFSYVVLAQTSVLTFRLQFGFSHCSSFSRPIYHVPLLPMVPNAVCVGVEIIFSIILALPFLVTFSKSLTSVEWTHILLDTICMTFILVWAPLSVEI